MPEKPNLMWHADEHGNCHRECEARKQDPQGTWWCAACELLPWMTFRRTAGDGVLCPFAILASVLCCDKDPEQPAESHEQRWARAGYPFKWCEEHRAYCIHEWDLNGTSIRLSFSTVRRVDDWISDRPIVESPEPLRWTNARPTKLGFYWTEAPMNGRRCIAEVVDLEDDGFAHPCGCGSDAGHPLSYFRIWYGPLEPPEGAP